MPSFGGFIQQDPVEGAPATEPTDAWIFFDDENLYVAARCWDSQPGRQIVNEMRRDSNGIIQNESLTVIFDTFNDKRNGVFFQTKALSTCCRALCPTPTGRCTAAPNGRSASAAGAWS